MYKISLRLMSATQAFDRTYSYLSDADYLPGTLVAVPFGNSDRHQYGIVVAAEETDDEAGLKRILFALREPYSLTDIQLGTAQFISERFFASFGECARLMLPTGLDIDTAEYVIKGENFDGMENADISQLFRDSEKVYLTSELTKKDVMPLVKKGYLRLKTEAVCHINEKTERYAKALKTDEEEISTGLRGTKKREK